MENLLETIKSLITDKESTEKALQKYILDRVFGDIPEDEKLGARVRVGVSHINVSDGLGPMRSEEVGGMSDIVSSFVRKVSFTANITLVFPEDRSWQERSGL